MLISAALVGALLTAAAPAPSEPAFTRAYLNHESLCFDSPVELDWEAIARREFKAFPIDAPTVEQLQKYEGEPDAPPSSFSTGLPDSLSRLHFYLLADTGPQPIVPERLRLTLSYVLPLPDKPKLRWVTGEVCLRIPNGLESAGFVATSRAPLTWHHVPATLARSGAVTRVQLKSGTSEIPPPELNERDTQVKTAYILSSAEQTAEYLLVRRVTDPSRTCEFVYDLYRWKPELPAVAANAYRCDV